jgi:catechol 2,3-dioxygenase-like lactoylglutathione lyase family enzyme
MAVVLNHTIVPSRDKDKAARFYAKIFDLEYDGPGPHFAPVKLNETLTFDFSDATTFDFHHYAFHVSDADFDSIISRIITLEIPYGSSYRSPEDRQWNSTNGGRGFYFRDPDGHSLELPTRV